LKTSRHAIPTCQFIFHAQLKGLSKSNAPVGAAVLSVKPGSIPFKIMELSRVKA
jgi:hypothetical protein